MKRLRLSVVCGFLIPFLYAVIVGPLTYTNNFTLRFWLNQPIEWPLSLHYLLAGQPRHPLAGYDMGVLIYVFACNVILYSLITYFLLLIFSALRRRKTANA